jgi:gamma-glutamyl:cysteine ligase YbdK (ATP-grasp superfamily)
MLWPRPGVGARVGHRIDRDRFEEAEYRDFAERLEGSLAAMRELLARPGFGVGPASIGAELELSLVDARARPLPKNQAVLTETADPRMTVELDRFNLECNLRHCLLAGRPFAALQREVESALAEVRRAAGVHGGRVAMIGILPTLRRGDLEGSAMTDTPRFRALSAGLRRRRREPFRVRIEGDDSLDIACDSVTFEGANTSLQVHLRVAPAAFAATYNAVQIATAPALAVACNSPTFLGHRLWEETRVALFQQAVDDRGEGPRREPRVCFRRGWAREGAFELFAENVARHEALLPILSEEDPLECVRSGGVPRLEEMRLHQGTVWKWNRAIFDPAEGGHLRIEMRSLPAGPTAIDMLANIAFLVGLAEGMAPEASLWIRSFPFEFAHRNFYRAARSGLGAEFLFPAAAGEAPRPVEARELVLRLLPLAHRGLERAGVASDERDSLLAVIEARAGERRGGATWQRQVLDGLEARHGREDALVGMLERYLACSEDGQPVHRWPLES